MWFEESSWSNLRLTDMGHVEEWRDLWPTKIEFIVSAMAYLFAMTNFLNLPKLILDNGGVAFAAAYAAVVGILCMPTMIMEMSIGQVTGRAPVLAFYHLFPVFKGIGVAQILFTLVVLACMTKFLSTLCLFLYYFTWTITVHREGLPWLNCKQFPEFVSHPCREAGSITNITQINNRLNTIQAESSMMQFLLTLERPSESIADFKDFQYSILISQGAIWLGVFICICFGVRWVGKPISVCLMLAFATLLVFFLRSATLGGVTEILEIYWKATDWERLYDYRVWRLAVEQAILGTGIGYGAFITMSSYMKRHNNLVTDSIFLSLWHLIITFVQTMSVICIVGFLSQKLGIHPSELLETGEDQMWYMLAYVSYLPRLWSAILLAVSIFTMFSVIVILALSVLSTVEDSFGANWSKCCRRFMLALFVCAFCYGLTVYFATQAGRHAYELATRSIKYCTIYFILTAELFATAWFYCAHKLGRDLHSMMKSKCCSCFGHFFLYFTYLLPILPAGVAFLNAMDYKFTSFSAPIHEWKYSEYVGIAIAMVPLLPIPLYFFMTILCACCCKGKDHQKTCKRIRGVFGSRLQNQHHQRNEKSQPIPRYTSNAPGYLLLPQAPLAEPEIYA
ncbi:CRE-SNF-1 protein [Caenorhabditis remanei]|uniref:CRE-SNF-1 protein n=1 Tax=Caenorhabditis remanei TaxID=31234 RepID=E3NJ11_CAERE|nr:CRE-SNF-1 protein [Caenorhabditis remanei]